MVVEVVVVVVSVSMGVETISSASAVSFFSPVASSVSVLLAVVAVVVMLLLLLLLLLLVVVVVEGSKPKYALVLVITILPDLSPETNKFGAKQEEAIAVTSFVWVTCSSTNNPVSAFHTQILRSLPPEARRKPEEQCCEKATAVIFAPLLCPRKWCSTLLFLRTTVVFFATYASTPKLLTARAEAKYQLALGDNAADDFIGVCRVPPCRQVW